MNFSNEDSKDMNYRNSLTGVLVFFFLLFAPIASFAAIDTIAVDVGISVFKTIPIGIAYPVWTGIGAVGAVLLGIFVFHEPATFWRLFFITTLTASIIGLKIVSE